MLNMRLQRQRDWVPIRKPQLWEHWKGTAVPPDWGGKLSPCVSGTLLPGFQRENEGEHWHQMRKDDLNLDGTLQRNLLPNTISNQHQVSTAPPSRILRSTSRSWKRTKSQGLMETWDPVNWNPPDKSCRSGWWMDWCDFCLEEVSNTVFL